MPYVDVRYYGLSTQGYYLYYADGISPWFNLPPAPGNNYVYSQWMAVVGGSTANITLFYQQLRWNGGVPGVATLTSFVPTSTLTQYVHTAAAPSGGNTTSILASTSFNCSTTQPIDITLRYGPAQIELGQARTPQIWNPVGVPGWSTRALLAMPDVLGPPGVQYASAQINGTGGIAAAPSWTATVRTVITGFGGHLNFHYNPNHVGAVVGTPGTLPTSWSNGTGIAGQQVVGFGAADPTTGLPYLDLRIFGTTTSTTANWRLALFAPTVVGQSPTAGTGETWTQSLYLGLMAGAQAGISFGLGIYGLAANGTIPGGTPAFVNIGVLPAGTVRRYTRTMVMPGPGVASVLPTIMFQWANATALDFTIRICGEQLELGSGATLPVMLPPPGQLGFSSAGVLWQQPVAEIDGVGNVIANPTLLVAATLSTETGMVFDPRSVTDPVNTTLSSDNRTIRRATNSGFDGARGIIPPQTTGKYYAEFTPPRDGTVWNFSCSIGVCNVNANYTGLYNSATNGCVFQPLYGIWVHNTDTVLLHNDWLNQETAAMAVDLDNERIWFRVLPNGLWNGQPGADPTIPSTGVDLSPIPSLALQVVATVNLDNRCIQINAGSTPFLGPVPAGFVSWPAPGHVQATPQLLAATAAEADGVGALQATARVLVSAGRVAIAGGEGNRLDQRQIPTANAPNTAVVSTDIAPPSGVYTPVYLHSSGTTTDTQNGLVWLTNPTPLIPYRWGVWVYIPSAWSGNYLNFQCEGPGTSTATFTSAVLATRDQWQFLSFETDALTLNGGRLVCRSQPISPPQSFYTAGWFGIPDTVVGGAVSRETSVSRIAGTGGVIANAAVLRPAYAQIPGGGVTNYVRNPRAEGAVPGVFGSGGVYPSFWGPLSDVSGLIRTIVGTGTDAATGLPYVDLRFSGTTAAGSVYSITAFESLIQRYTGGSVYGVSCYFALVGGSLANLTSITLSSRMTLSAAVFPFTPTATLTRFSFVHNTAGADSTWQPAFTINFPTTGVAIDFTLRVAAPQWELGSYGVTAPILPPPGVPGFASRSVLPLPVTLAQAACTIAGTGAIATAEQVGIVGAKLSTQTAAVWDPASANFPALTLFSNENRTIRFTSNGVDGARGTVLLSGGKLYCEFTPGAVWNQDNSFGLASTSATYNGLYNDGEHGCVLQPTYGVYVHHTWPNILTSTWNALETVALAVDLDNDRAWFRLLPSGLWNGVPGADPTIPSTGIDISIIPSQQLQLVAGLGDLNSGGTLNAGSVPFLASVPAGYSGWPPRGYLQAGPFVREQASAAIGGVSALRANAGPVLPTGAILAGAGTLFADPHPARPAVATLPGVGSFAADAAPRKAAGGLIVGVGQLTTSAWELAQAAATLAATATLAANGIRVAQTYLAGATFAGTGSLVATVTAGGGAAALIAGTGGVLGAGVSRLLAQANLPGVSSLVVDGAGWRPGLARMAGLGSLRADAHPARAARSTIPGQGGVTNWVRNPRGDNPALGTYAPGVNTTTPTWWDTDVGTGLQRQLIGSFTVDGIDVLRMRAWGMPDPSTDPTYAIANAIFEYTPEYTPGVGFLTGMAEGQTYTRSFYLRLVDGSWANTQHVTFWGITQGRTGGPVDPRTLIAPLPGSTLTRYTDTVTATGGTPPYQVVGFGLTIDRVDPPAYIDVTFDIGGGQVELGPLTGLILPQPGQLGASTRALQAAPFALVSAAARISGDSSVTVGAATQERAAARIGGEGWLVAAAYSPAQQVVSGEGNFVAISSQIIAAAGARLDGVGLVRAAGYSGVSYARARIDGSSDCWAEDYWLTSQPVTRLHGVGQVTASTVAHLIAGAAPTAISHLSADAVPTVFVGARFWPEGNLIATPSVLQSGAAARFGGVGTLTVNGLSSLAAAKLGGVGQVTAAAFVTSRRAAAATLRGVGQVTAPANLRVPVGGQFLGDGQLIADGTAVETSGQRHAAALLAGSGRLAATPAGKAYVAARLAGLGRLAANGLAATPGRVFAAALLAGDGRLVGRVPGRVQAAALIPGVGHLAADTVAHLIAGTAPTGISHLQVVLSQVFPAVMVGARLWPEGKLVALGNTLAHASATLAGAGAVQATAGGERDTVAQLVGTGHFDAQASASRILAATVGSTGRLAADAIVLRPAAARLAGEGFLVQGDNDGLLFAAAHLAGEGRLAVDPGIATYESGALIAGEGAFPADHPWDDELLRGTTGQPPIHVLAAALAQLGGTGRLTTSAGHTTLGAALIAGEGRLTDYRGGTIHDETDMSGRVSVRHSLTGAVRGAISLVGRLRPKTLLSGIVQGDQKK